MNDIEDFGECVLGLSMPDGDLKYYGAFASGKEAKAWADKQFAEGLTPRASFFICPLRNLNLVRKNDDWWMRDELHSREWLEQEFPNFNWDKYPINQ